MNKLFARHTTFGPTRGTTSIYQRRTSTKPVKALSPFIIPQLSEPTKPANVTEKQSVTAHPNNGMIEMKDAPALKDDNDTITDIFLAKAQQNDERRVLLQTISFFISNGVSLIVSAAIIYSIYIFSQARGGGASSMLNGITQSPAKLADASTNDKKTTFSMIAGLDSAKRELYELVDFLKHPERYAKVGVKIPTGYLLVGPPGTGKTLLSRAIANEADVPFFYCSASEFLQVFVGVGASRIRDLFTKAKEKAPCIIFIDELDAIGKARSGGAGSFGGGNDEREQTINQLLTELNGFEENKGVMVIAATNRVDVLDKALLRPGRFDRQIVVGLPDLSGREAIMRVHTSNKPLAKDVNLRNIAHVTPGFSGADLENLANEAAICAAREMRDAIEQSDFDEALEKITIGLEKGGQYLSPRKRHIVAVHEAGHALTAMLLDDYDEVKKVTISPRGGTGGTTQFLPDSERLDSGLYSKAYLQKSLVVALGGRAAECIVFGEDNITTGASSDMLRVNQIARAMIMSYGFSSIIGTVGYNPNDVGLFSPNPVSAELMSIVDSEVVDLASTAYKTALTLIEGNRRKLDAIANALLERETLTGYEIYELLASVK